jgi:hypothetical protein
MSRRAPSTAADVTSATFRRSQEAAAALRLAVTAALPASNVNVVARYADVDSLAGGITAVVMREVSRYLAGLGAAGGAAEAGATAAGAAMAADPEQPRRALLAALICAAPVPFPLVTALARAAGWPLPRRVAAVALAECAWRAPGLPPPGTLADLTRPGPFLLVPDPDGPGRQRAVEAALRGWLARSRVQQYGQPGQPLAAVGPAVPLADASASLRWARQALALGGCGLASARDQIVWAADHLATLVLLADADLAGILSREALAPLARLRPEQADRLAVTLLAWLESADDASAAARRLHVHPQTIRYRLRQLSGLFGDALADPDARFRLLLALRARQSLRQAAGRLAG